MVNVRRLAAVSAATLVGMVGAIGGIGAVGAGSAGAASSQKPLTIVVTNDDGYNAPGIDTMVQALRALPKVTVKVVAPATNQSGTGSKTTPGTIMTTKAKTLSGYPAVAVQGYPADTIAVALGQLHLHPNLVVGPTPRCRATSPSSWPPARLGSRSHARTSSVVRGVSVH